MFHILLNETLDLHLELLIQLYTGDEVPVAGAKVVSATKSEAASLAKDEVTVAGTATESGTDVSVTIFDISVAAEVGSKEVEASTNSDCE